ncbi:MAG: DUF1365 domain-containing protein [Acidobacteria bacterium]|nr:DUF1365 domain-containing protein [Acidobacteriota bacterium]
MESAIYTGTLRHRRFAPARHEFSYPLFMAFLDIDGIPDLMRVSPFSSYNRWNWASFDERDHFGDPALPLRERLRAAAAEQALTLPGGPIFLLTHLRYLGYAFNPISVFYCFSRERRLDLILAEVNNTFGESRNYWLSGLNRLTPSTAHVYRCPKALHVSPFMPMDLEYRFALTVPGERLIVHMNTLQGAHSCFDATLSLRRQPWSASALHRALGRFPCVTAKTIAAIHWQALRLFLKKVPVFTHPARSPENHHE